MLAILINIQFYSHCSLIMQNSMFHTLNVSIRLDWHFHFGEWQLRSQSSCRFQSSIRIITLLCWWVGVSKMVAVFVLSWLLVWFIFTLYVVINIIEVVGGALLLGGKVLTMVFNSIILMWTISRCLFWKWHTLCMIGMFSHILRFLKSDVGDSKISEDFY